MKHYEVWGDEQGIIFDDCKSIREARAKVKELKKNDVYLKEIGEADIEDTYRIYEVIETDTQSISKELK